MSRSVAILGSGLIGGSLAMALRRGEAPWNISVWTRREEAVASIKKALPDCQVTHHLEEAVANVDIVVLCTPPHAITAAGETLARILPTSTFVTDAGSVKQQIVSTLESELGGRFIGAHPMAGSEQSGIAAARRDLFDGALCLLTPTPASDPNAIEAVRRMWADAGCVLQTISPEEHDRSIARVSHLPHAAAAALVQAVCRGGTDITALAGSGYRDSTRVAGGPEEMWAEILLDNGNEIVKCISDLQALLEELKTNIAQGDRRAVETFLGKARKLRTSQDQET